MGLRAGVGRGWIPQHPGHECPTPDTPPAVRLAFNATAFPVHRAGQPCQWAGGVGTRGPRASVPRAECGACGDGGEADVPPFARRLGVARFPGDNRGGAVASGMPGPDALTGIRMAVATMGSGWPAAARRVGPGAALLTGGLLRECRNELRNPARSAQDCEGRKVCRRRLARPPPARMPALRVSPHPTGSSGSRASRRRQAPGLSPASSTRAGLSA